MKIQRIARTQPYIQLEGTECGAICLQIISAYWGGHYSPAYLRKLCGISRDGSNLQNMVEAAESLGLIATPLMADLPEEASMESNIADMREAAFPYIIHWNLDHFVVLEGIKGRKFYINDPAGGRYTVDYNEFMERFCGPVLLLEPTPNFKKNKSHKSFSAGFWLRIKNQKWHFFMLVLLTLLMFIPGFILPTMTQVFIDKIIISQQTQWFRAFIWIFSAVSVLEVLMLSLQMKGFLYLQTALSVDQSTRFLKKILALPSLFFSQRHIGDLSSRLQSNDKIAVSLTSEFIGLFGMVNIVLYWLVILFLSPMIAAVTLFLGLFLIVSLWIYSYLVTGLALLYEQNAGKMITEVTVGIESIDDIKVGDQEFNLFNRVTGSQATVLQNNQDLNLKAAWANAVPQLVIGLNQLALVGLGGWLVMQGEMSLGTLIACSMLLNNIYQPLMQVNQTVINLKKIEGLFARQDDVFDYPTLSASNNKETPDYYHIKLDKMSFSYNPTSALTLSDINLTIGARQKIVIMGETGSGKSTLINLLNGLYIPDSGTVLAGQLPIHLIPEKERAKNIATVSQTVVLFEGTIKENLTMFNDTLDELELIAALNHTGIYKKLLIRGGLNAAVGFDGMNFSGGERQQIEIAKALLQKPKLLILDEATSAMDTMTEYAILENIKTLDCTVVHVSHRLGMQKDADNIIILIQGKIVESGSHTALIAQKGHYYNLCQQVGGADNDIVS